MGANLNSVRLIQLLYKGQINALDRVQKKAAKFVHHKIRPNWEPLASRRKVSRLCALYKAYCGERAWKDIGDSVVENHTSCNILNGLAIFTTYGAWEKQCDPIHYPIDRHAKVKVPTESEY